MQSRFRVDRVSLIENLSAARTPHLALSARFHVLVNAFTMTVIGAKVEIWVRALVEIAMKTGK